jgi:hypothetical protein
LLLYFFVGLPSAADEICLFPFFIASFSQDTLKARGRKHENLQRKRLWLKYFASRALIKEMLDERRGKRRVASAHPMKIPRWIGHRDQATTVTPSQHFVRSRATNDSPTVTPSDTRDTMLLPAVCGADKPHS